MPSLKTVHEAYGDKGLAVLLVIQNKSPKDTIAPFVKEFSIPFPVIYDGTGEVSKQYRIRAHPTTYVIGRDGREIALALGKRDWDSEAGKRAIDLLLGSSRPAEKP
ncbi:MAG: TlpA family protein disulfide reductase [Nitrospirae bacterium]|nr:TlpA family protein disulfide reductase [Nitrospirota bacterium]